MATLIRLLKADRLIPGLLAAPRLVLPGCSASWTACGPCSMPCCLLVISAVVLNRCSALQVQVRKATQPARDGSITVMHSHGGKASATALALPAIFAGLKAQELTFVNVTDLIQPCRS